MFGKTIKIAYKKSILKECIRSYFLHGSIFCLGIYMSVSKPSMFLKMGYFKVEEQVAYSQHQFDRP